MISKRSSNSIKWALFATICIAHLLIFIWAMQKTHPDKETRTESVQAVGE